MASVNRSSSKLGLRGLMAALFWLADLPRGAAIARSTALRVILRLGAGFSEHFVSLSRIHFLLARKCIPKDLCWLRNGCWRIPRDTLGFETGVGVSLDTHVFRDRALAMEMAPVALSVAPALQEAAASGIWMQELSHPLMGLLCRAGDHPRQPPPHAACCCCAGRERLAAGVRCSWRSTYGVVSSLTRPSSGV